MRDAGFVDLIWLAGATGWSGTRQMLSTDRWALFQSELHKRFPVGGFGYDANVASPVFPDFGQFTPGAAGPVAEPAPFAAPRPAVPVLMEVIARSGLRVRSNPNDQSTILSSLPLGTIVHAIGQSGGWVQVDLEGDGRADGFMSGEFLHVAAGGFPLSPVSIATATAIATAGRRPVDIARAELALDVREVPGPASNPRIVLYHGSTSTGAEPDEVAWCSSFMNYCVEQAGFRGTDSKWAMSWHDSDWGTEVNGEPQDGDIAVFRRRAGSSRGAVRGGHVGFWTGETSSHIKLLGGNQGNRIKLTNYPKNGMLGSFHYQLLSIRRP